MVLAVIGGALGCGPDADADDAVSAQPETEGQVATTTSAANAGEAAAESSSTTEAEAPPTADPIVFTGHDGWVRAVAQLPDGRMVSGGDDNAVLVWDADDPEQVLVAFDKHQQSVFMVGALSDGRVVSGSGDATVQIWDPDDIDSGRAVLEGLTIALVSSDDEEVIRSTNVGAVTGAVLSNDSVLISYPLAGVAWWDSSSDTIRTLHEQVGVDRVGDGATLAFQANAMVQTDDGGLGFAIEHTVELLNLGTSSPADVVYADRFAQPIEGLASLADGRLVAGMKDGRVVIIDPTAQDDEEPVTYDGHEGGVRAIIALRDGRVVSAGTGGEVRVWSPDDPTDPGVTYDGHADTVFALTALDDGRVASAGADGTVQIWEPESS